MISFTDAHISVFVLNMTTSKTSLTISDLESGHIYNISVSAATVAGYGPHVTMTAITGEFVYLLRIIFLKYNIKGFLPSLPTPSNLM